ncbi:MAG: acyl-CoA dehydrogenase, partial [Limnohabitans sp.]|nr:acyl-CoA dehydrogenase [Limnohabitans sp.]
MSDHSATHPPELDWPFFDNSHRDFKVRLDAWCNEHLAHAHHDESRDAVDAECIRLVRLLGSGGWLKHAVSGIAYGAASDVIDTRQLCLLRETLAFHNGLSDFA